MEVEVSKIFIAERRKLNFCECKVSSMMKNGLLFRDEDEGKLWKSEEVKAFDDLVMAHHNEELTEVTDDLAIELELAKPYWEFFMALQNQPATVPAGVRIVEHPLC